MFSPERASLGHTTRYKWTGNLNGTTKAVAVIIPSLQRFPFPPLARECDGGRGHHRSPETDLRQKPGSRSTASGVRPGSLKWGTPGRERQAGALWPGAPPAERLAGVAQRCPLGAEEAGFMHLPLTSVPLGTCPFTGAARPPAPSPVPLLLSGTDAPAAGEAGTTFSRSLPKQHTVRCWCHAQAPRKGTNWSVTSSRRRREGCFWITRVWGWEEGP